MPAPRPGFHTTRWSLVRAAQGGGVDAAARTVALGELCERYWYPLYAFARRSGCDEHDAQDVVQGFLGRWLEKGDLGAQADPDAGIGRFRSYLLGALRHFMANERRRDRAQKRGGAATTLSFDITDGEAHYGREPWHEATPDALFERSFAMTVLTAAIARLGEEYAARGKGPLFERLRGFLDGHDEPYAGLAAELGMTEGACKVAVHRLRTRFRQALRDEIAQTVGSPAEVDDELAHLRAALARPASS